MYIYVINYSIDTMQQIQKTRWWTTERLPYKKHN